MNRPGAYTLRLSELSPTKVGAYGLRSRGHTPSSSHSDNNSPAVSTFYGTASIFADDLEEPAFSYRFEKIARQRNGAGVRQRTEQETISIEIKEKTPHRQVFLLSSTTTSARTSEDASVTLDTLEGDDEKRNDAEQPRLHIPSPIAFNLARPPSLGIENELIGAAQTNDKEDEGALHMGDSAGQHLGSEQPSSPIPVTKERAETPATKSSNVIESPKLRSGSSPVRGISNSIIRPTPPKEAHVLRDLLDNALGHSPLKSPPTSSRKDDVQVQPNNKLAEMGGAGVTDNMEVQESIAPSVGVLGQVRRSKWYYGGVAIAWLTFFTLFKEWFNLVSTYSPQETLEQDLKEISFWFVFFAGVLLLLSSL